MSLLRQRAIAVSFESTLSALSPAAARAWFVRLTSWASEPELKALTSQASVVRGVPSRPIAVRANATRTRSANRRAAARGPRGSRRGLRMALGAIIDDGLSWGAGWGTGLPGP